MQYNSLKEYIEDRVEAIGETKTHLSEQLGWGPSYLNNIVNGQFKPSEDRCKKLARVFGDDPNIILGLAGYYVPHDFTDQEQRLLQTFRSISPKRKSDVFQFLDFLKYLDDTERTIAE